MMNWLRNSDRFELGTVLGMVAMIFIFIVSSLGASDIYPTLTNRSWNGVASWAQPIVASGTALPNVASAATGDLFMLTTGPSLYRLQGGAWAVMSSGAASSAISIITKSASYTVTTSDAFLLASTTTAFTFTLPPAASATGLVFDFKKISDDANYLYILATNSETIDGVASMYTNVQYTNLTVISNGGSWFVR